MEHNQHERKAQNQIGNQETEEIKLIKTYNNHSEIYSVGIQIGKENV